jgi:thioredoxin reductase (NADPH)
MKATRSSPGKLHASDGRSGSVKRVAAAIGEGSVAVRLAFDRLQAAGTGPDRNTADRSA